MHSYKLQSKPFIVPTDDGKLIEEHFGVPSTNNDDISFAHLIAPAGWEEPYQTPDFDEITYVIKGKKEVIIDGEKIIIHPNQSMFIGKGTRVRYSNPFDEEAEYISVCLPAFTLERAHREEA
jgi:mannose-6-phosphate isomerase-like protein (cupin superfamily)